MAQRGRKPLERRPAWKIEPEILEVTEDENYKITRFRTPAGTCTMLEPKNVSEEFADECINNFIEAGWKLCHPGEPVPDKIRLVVD